MKYILFILAFVFILSPSCKKGYTCTCDQSIDTTGGKAIVTFDMPREAAKEKCSQMLSNPYYTNCFLQ